MNVLLLLMMMIMIMIMMMMMMMEMMMVMMMALEVLPINIFPHLVFQLHVTVAQNLDLSTSSLKFFPADHCMFIVCSWVEIRRRMFIRPRAAVTSAPSKSRSRCENTPPFLIAQPAERTR